jgi:hypothetical protein
MQLEIKHLLIVLLVLCLLFAPLVLRAFVIDLWRGIDSALTGR